MILLADRFLRDRDCWFDIATAEAVVIAVCPAGPLRAQIAWAERATMLERLRHSLLNPLIDFGIADPTSFFEAYAIGSPVVVSTYSAACLVAHLGRFLQAHGVSLTTAEAAFMLRPMRRATGTRVRPLGFVIQPRRACETLRELFGDSLRGGATPVRVAGASGSGLRTFALTAARYARLEGFVPVCPRALLRWPALFAELDGRHVCLITDAAMSATETGVAAKLMSRLALRTARPHICLSVRRRTGTGDGTIHLDSLGMTCMTTMMYVDPDFGPSPSALLTAARNAAGMPGRFLTELAGQPFDLRTPTHHVVHETPAEYGVPVPPGENASESARCRRSRIASVLWRAGSRAAALECRGRHAAATRLLTRAARVLEGRRDLTQAARYWLQLAWIARNRGALAAAQTYSERAREADPSPDNQINAAWVTAVCWTDDNRLADAEASLRTLLVGASELNNAPLRFRCLLALARVMYWQGRSPEMLAMLAPIMASADADFLCEALLLTSRARIATGDLPGALLAARDGSRRAIDLGDQRLRSKSYLAVAVALCAAGDIEGVRAQVRMGLHAAAAAHLPLTALRLRALLLQAVGANAADGAEARRTRNVLQRALRHQVPALIARRIESACTADCNRPGRSGPASPPVATVEMFLEVAQRSKDDLAAVQEVSAALCEHLGAASLAVLAVPDGHVVGCAGRQWRERSTAVQQALASGRAVAIDDSREPKEAAEPVRCGGVLIGILGCRFVCGAVKAPDLVGATLRAAAIALATHLRAVLDARVSEPPPAVWGDLLGETAVAAALREAVYRASRAPFPVLIEGESGSGKELVARAIHKLSARHTRRFCAINCAALSDELVEAELFGHTRGAFTGATAERAGLFEEADGGTLFLDEVVELSARAQAKLLRVVQEGEVRRVGENLPRRVDVRIVAATNRRLEDEASHGRFRTDLRFRLDVLRIVVPPLRERAGDIPLLAQHFWRHASARVGSSATLGPDTLAALSRYDWPGNVRELQNAIAWIAVHAPRRGRVSTTMLPARLASSPMATGSFEAAREEFERRYVRAALAQAGGQRQAAARAMGVTRQGLAKMLRRLGIEQEGIA